MVIKEIVDDIPGFFLLCAPSFDCCTIRLEVDFRRRTLLFFGSFRHIQSPYYILLFPFLLKYVLIIQCSSLNNSYYRRSRQDLCAKLFAGSG